MSEVNNETIEKSEDKKDIEVEEREKMLNEENKALDAKEKEALDETDDKKVSKEMKEGMEVKPKKIPIGGIQMPGFFMRSKSKERCKDDLEQNEIEGTELIEKNSEANVETPSIQTRIKLPNPFRRSKADDDGDKSVEPKEKKKLLDTIKLPLVSVFPRKKKDDNLEQQTAQAGLASMETLDDKSTDEKNIEDLKNVSLNDKDKPDVELQDQSKQQTWLRKLKLYKVAICALVTFILLLVILIILVFPGKQYPVSPTIRDGKYIETVTGCGPIEGIKQNDIWLFHGVPYARPPIEDLRFKYAQPLNNISYCWKNTFFAYNPTGVCLQILSNGSVIGKEDCLTLDIFTPYVRYDNPLPVVVLIGAESFVGGSPGQMIPSETIIKSKEVIFVRPNFRLGALGFLALDVLSKSDYPNTSGNYGLSDILEALKWIQLNIEHFGGDKHSVTLWGHQTGATMVMALATISSAPKYFARVWASSGSAIYPKKPLSDSEIDFRSFLVNIGCGVEDVECLRKMEAEKLVTSVEDTWRKPHPDLPMMEEREAIKQHQWMVIDGKILQDDPEKDWTEKLSVPVILGTTAQSGNTEKLQLKNTEWSEQLVKEHISQSILSDKNLVKEALQKYPYTYKGLSTMISDIRIVCPLWIISSQIRTTPFYVVSQGRSSLDLADINIDLDAILGNFEGTTYQQKKYVSNIQHLFYDYVYHGKIEQNMIGQSVLLIDDNIRPNATYSYCEFWKENKIVLSYAAIGLHEIEKQTCIQYIIKLNDNPQLKTANMYICDKYQKVSFKNRIVNELDIDI